MQIRPARASDLEAILAIHNQVVTASTAIYEDLPSTLEQRQQWYDARIAQGYPVLVAVDGQQAIGYATFGEWRSRWVTGLLSNIRCMSIRTGAATASVGHCSKHCCRWPARWASTR